MKSLRLFLIIAVIASTACWFPTASKAQSGFHPGIFNHRFNSQRQMLQRQLWRPNIKVVRPRGADRRLSGSGRHTYEFYVKRGWVSRIEIRSGLKVVKTISVGKSRSGRGTFTLSPSDRTAIKRGFKLWAWQGQGGYQSVHGESIGYKLD